MRKITVAMLTILLAGFMCAGIYSGLYSTKQYCLLGIGIALGVLYLINCGKLPRWLLWANKIIPGTGLRSEDDPQNLPDSVMIAVLGVVFITLIVAMLSV